MAGVINILQIDVEDWYTDLPRKYWKYYEDRIVQNTNKILRILKKSNIQATFFIIGYFAKRYPELVEKINNENHEIGSHGYNHSPITQQTPNEFEEDLLKSIKILEKITNENVLGFRAPFFTLDERTSWAIDIMKKCGLKYDSSIFPVKTHLYGVPDAPLFPYYISSSNIKKNDPNGGFLEIPLSVYRIPVIKKNIPIAGGFCLRFFPYKFISYGIKKINKKHYPAVFYIHPWEFDPNHPRINTLGWISYYFHYHRLHDTEKKFVNLLREFKFTSSRNWINHEK